MGILIRAYDKAGNPLGFLPDFTDLKEQVADDTTGSLTFQYLRDGINANLLDQDELYLNVFEDGVQHEALFMLEDDTDDEASNINRRRWMNVSARYYMGVLDQAVVYPQGHNATATNLYGLAPQHKFHASPGSIMKTLILLAKARGCFNELVYDFGTLADSNNTPWPTEYDITYPAGTNYLQVLADMIDAGWVDARMSGRTLKLYVPDTYFGNTGYVLRYGQNVKSAPRKRSRRSIFSHVLAAGDAEKKATTQVGNDTTAGRFGRREGYVADTRLTTIASLQSMGNNELTKHQQQREGFTLDMVIDPVPGSPSWPRPGIDFRVGDKVYYDRYRKSATEYQPCVVRSMTFAWGDTKSAPTCSIELNDLFLKNSIRQSQQIAAATGGNQTTNPSPRPSPAPDLIPPQNPATCTVASEIYLVTSGVIEPTYRGKATVSWDAVTLDADGSTMNDFGHYEVETRLSGGAWSAAQSTTGTSVEVADLRPGQTIQARVCAVDISGNRSSLTTSDMATVPIDTTPTPAPSGPVLSQKLGAVTVGWDGQTSTAGSMPPDFRFVEVQQCTEDTFASSPKILDRIYVAGGSIVVTGQAYGTPMYYRLIAVDAAGNRSTPGASGSITTTQLVNGDLAADIIAKLDNGDAANTLVQGWRVTGKTTIDGGKLETDTVTALAIKAGVIGATKLAIGDTANMAWVNESQPGVIDNHAIVTDAGGVRWSTRTDNSKSYLWRDTAGPIPFKAGDRIRVTYSAYVLSGTNSATPRIRYGDLTGWNLSPVGSSPTSITTAPQDFIYEGVVPDAIGSNTSFSIGFATSTGVDVRIRNVRAYRMGAGELLVDGSISTLKLAANSVTTDKLDAGAVNAEKISLGIIRSNLVPNPSFEETLATQDLATGSVERWRKEITTGDVYRAAGRGRSGNYGLTIFSPAGTASRATSGVFPVTPGSTYKLSMYAYRTSVDANMVVDLLGGAAKDAVTTPVTLNIDGEFLQPPASATPPAYDGFQQYSWDFTPDAGINYVAIRVANSNPISDSSVVIDDVAALLKGVGGGSEMTAAGLRLFDDEGLEVGAFVSNRPSYFSVTKAGQTVAAITDSGAIYGASLGITSQDVRVADADLIGAQGLTMPGSAIYDSSYGRDYATIPPGILEDRGKGVIAYYYTTGSTYNLSPAVGVEYGLFQIGADLEPGRMYRLQVTPILVNGGPSGGGLALIARQTYNNAPLSFTSNINQRDFQSINTSGWASMQLNQVFFGNDTTQTSTDFLISLVNYGSSSAVSVYSGQAILATIEDIGTAKSNGATATVWNTTTTAPTSPKKTYTKAWTATSSESYGLNSGSSYSARSGTDLFHGYYSGNQGDQFSQLIFPDLTGSIASTATINKVELYLLNKHTYYSSMSGLKVGLSQSATLSSTPLGTQSGSFSFNEGQGKWIDITSQFNASGVGRFVRRIQIGKAGNSSLSSYGYFASQADAGGKPQLRVTYTQ